MRSWVQVTNSLKAIAHRYHFWRVKAANNAKGKLQKDICHAHNALHKLLEDAPDDTPRVEDITSVERIRQAEQELAVLNKQMEDLNHVIDTVLARRNTIAHIQVRFKLYKPYHVASYNIHWSWNLFPTEIVNIGCLVKQISHVISHL